MSEFKVGSKVKIAPTSEFYGISSSNPKDEVGIVVEVKAVPLGVRVNWSDSIHNSYNLTDLILVGKEPRKAKPGKDKEYVDPEGDILEVDTASSDEYVYFTTQDGNSSTIRLGIEHVKKIRKQLGHWINTQEQGE